MNKAFTSASLPQLDKLFDPETVLLSFPQPPSWLVTEAQQKIVLLLNHILMQEPAATIRFERQAGRVIQVEWASFQHFSLSCVITKAGLLDLATADEQINPDLKITVEEASPLLLTKAVLQGDTPSLQIAGDVQLAAEVNWVVQHTRWDFGQDLERLFGAVIATQLIKCAARIRQALQAFNKKNKTPSE